MYILTAACLNSDHCRHFGCEVTSQGCSVLILTLLLLVNLNPEPWTLNLEPWRDFDWAHSSQRRRMLSSGTGPMRKTSRQVICGFHQPDFLMASDLWILLLIFPHCLYCDHLFHPAVYHCKIKPSLEIKTLIHDFLKFRLKTWKTCFYENLLEL